MAIPGSGGLRVRRSLLERRHSAGKASGFSDAAPLRNSGPDETIAVWQSRPACATTAACSVSVISRNAAERAQSARTNPASRVRQAGTSAIAPAAYSPNTIRFASEPLA